MKLENVSKKKNPGYPSFKDHSLKRRSMLKVIFGGFAAFLAFGCGRQRPKVVGEMAEPAPPKPVEVKLGGEPQPPEHPVRSEGTPLPPKPPVVPEGDIKIPTSPRLPGKPMPINPPVRTKGKISPVNPPKELPLKPPIDVDGLMMEAEPPPKPKEPISEKNLPLVTPVEELGDIEIDMGM